MTLGERIKKVRRSLDLTQQDFCKRIGFKQNSISLVESGKRNISDQAIKSICREFNINEAWLRNEEGEMFIPSPTSELDALAAKYPQMTHETYVFIEKLVGLPESTQNTIMGFLKEVVDSFGDVEFGTLAFPGQSTSVFEPSSAKPPQKMSSAQLHAELDRQLAEEKIPVDGQSVSGHGSSEKVSG